MRAMIAKSCESALLPTTQSEMRWLAEIRGYIQDQAGGVLVREA